MDSMIKDFVSRDYNYSIPKNDSVATRYIGLRQVCHEKLSQIMIVIQQYHCWFLSYQAKIKQYCVTGRQSPIWETACTLNLDVNFLCFWLQFLLIQHFFFNLNLLSFCREVLFGEFLKFNGFLLSYANYKRSKIKIIMFSNLQTKFASLNLQNFPHGTSADF